MSEEDEAQNPISKSQRKRDMHSLQETGRQLTLLSPEQLAQIPLPENLVAAITGYQTIASREAKRRQLQYIGKLMKAVDDDVVRHELERFTQGSAYLTILHHQAEDLRSKLLTGDSAAVTDLVNQFPHCDVQLLRQLVRHARHDAETHKNRGNSKKLYRFLRETILKRQQGGMISDC